VKKVRKIHWADSSGNVLAVAQEKEESLTAAPAEVKSKSQDPRTKKSRWGSDRKKKDLLHEKEGLLLQTRYVLCM
jgi:hypothetical protein